MAKRDRPTEYIHPLFEELEAFDPHWVDRFNSLQEAVDFVGEETPYIHEMHQDFLNSPEGEVYFEEIAMTFDYGGAIKQEQEALRRLRFNLSNIGTVPGGQNA